MEKSPPEAPTAERPARTTDEDLSPIAQTTTAASERTMPPPDGGTRAWLVCWSAHIMSANTWGIINSFGIFQAYYADFLGLPPSQISWIGSMQFIMANLFGVIAGRLSDTGHFQLMLAVGCVLMFLGTFLTSYCHEYWQFMLSQGILYGFGAGLVACPIMSVTSTYFSNRRGLAVGIISCGTVTGGLIYPAMARQLLPSIGFAWTIRAMAFVQLGTSLPVNAIMRARLKTKMSGPLIDLSGLKDVPFALLCFGMLFGQAGNYTAVYYIAQFSRTQISPPLPYTDSLNLVLIFSGVTFFGRIVPAYLADKLGALNMAIAALIAASLLAFSWIGVTTPTGIYVWTVFYGLIGGSIMVLHPAATLSLSRDARSAGARMGLAFTINTGALVVGAPVAGAIIGRLDGKYFGAQVYVGCLLLLSSVMVSGAKVARSRTGAKWTERV